MRKCVLFIAGMIMVLGCTCKKPIDTDSIKQNADKAFQATELEQKSQE